MAQNSLSPAFVKLFYSRTGVEHTMTIPTKFYTAPTVGESPSLLTHAGGQYPFDNAVDDLILYLKPLWANTMSFGHAEVWSQPTPEDDPLWIYTYAVGVAGTSANANVIASQIVMTFRSTLGGLFRLYGMEASYAVNQAFSLAGFDTALGNLSTYIIASASWVYARDNGKPITTLGAKTKTNDVLRRKLLTG